MVDPSVKDAQVHIGVLFRDLERHTPLAGLAWLTEEVGELSRAIRSGDHINQEEELADVFAWTLSMANILDIDLSRVFLDKYGSGCPKCEEKPCSCLDRQKSRGMR
jgi:NTP pyrophosphatase (non-canonical NTP hydrolase)